MKIVWPVIASAPADEARVPEARIAEALGAEEDEAQAGQREMHADRDDQQHEHGGIGEALVGQAIDERAEQRDDRQRQRALHRAGGS